MGPKEFVDKMEELLDTDGEAARVLARKWEAAETAPLRATVMTMPTVRLLSILTDPDSINVGPIEDDDLRDALTFVLWSAAADEIDLRIPPRVASRAAVVTDPDIQRLTTALIDAIPDDAELYALNGAPLGERKTSRGIERIVDDVESMRLRVMCDAATPGPWTKEGYGTHHGDQWNAGPASEIDREADAAFIAESRTALPRALDEIAYQRKLLAEGRNERERLRSALLEACQLANANIHTPTMTSFVGAGAAGAAGMPSRFTAMTIDTGKPYRDKARIAELVKLGRGES